MSFMFNPHPYDDFTAINRPKLSENTVNAITTGIREIAEVLADKLEEKLKAADCAVMALDGYAGASWDQTVSLIARNLKQKNINFIAFDISLCYLASAELDEKFGELLPEDRVKDPVLLFGKLFKGDFEEIFNIEKINNLKNMVTSLKGTAGEKTAVVIYGCGCAARSLRNLYDFILYFDLTPKQAVLRAKNGLAKNLGDDRPRPFKEMLRRSYYVDFELTGHLRWELLKNGELDYYVASDDTENARLIPREALDEIFSALAEYPYRCKPVYIEGVWGGQYVKKIRKLPDTIRNVAWVFDLIPLEVSIVVEAGKNLLEFPYFTFVQKEGIKIMGEKCVEKFHGYFPIRFNYDDTFHSSGNMSIQVHPGEKYCKENFNEHGRQDESYYVVATGHGAKTYVGFNEGIDVDEFISEAKKSEREFTTVDHDKYVNSFPSVPGKQFLLPAGTIHASGRNQVILEIGSLTVGSYTYKMYDYLRADLDGIQRPIHTYHGERVLQKDRKTGWVSENLVQLPRLRRKGKDWAEYIVGEHDLIYFSLRRLEFEKSIDDDTAGVFHVMTLVDGEQIMVQSVENPENSYTAGYLDVVVVPACIGKYTIKNLGNQPVVVHKTLLREDFYEKKQ